MIKRLVVKVLLAAASLRAQTSSIEIKLMTEPVIQERLEMVSRKLAERRATLEKLSSDAWIERAELDLHAEGHGSGGGCDRCWRPLRPDHSGNGSD
jgi:hypothetical protein